MESHHQLNITMHNTNWCRRREHTSFRAEINSFPLLTVSSSMVPGLYNVGPGRGVQDSLVNCDIHDCYHYWILLLLPTLTCKGPLTYYSISFHWEQTFIFLKDNFIPKMYYDIYTCAYTCSVILQYWHCFSNSNGTVDRSKLTRNLLYMFLLHDQAQ